MHKEVNKPFGNGLIKVANDVYSMWIMGFLHRWQRLTWER